MFQQRHYALIAMQLEALKSSALVTVTEDTKELWVLTCKTLAWRFQDDNPNFKRHKFLSACGVDQ